MGRNEAIGEVLRELERVLALETTETLGDARRVGVEYSVRVNWAETQRLPRLDRLVSGDRGG